MQTNSIEKNLFQRIEQQNRQLQEQAELLQEKDGRIEELEEQLDEVLMTLSLRNRVLETEAGGMQGHEVGNIRDLIKLAD